jgi:hypothetical protein
MSKQQKQRFVSNKTRMQQVPAAKSYNIGSREEVFTLSDKERVLSYTPSATTFTATGFPCNPGLASSFPWLSGHAGLYDKYRIAKLVIGGCQLKAPLIPVMLF